MLDPRVVERQLADLTRYINEQGFETAEEVEEFVQRVTESGEFPEYKPETDLERAQQKMYDAWEASAPRKRLRLAKQALKISPNCADAYVLLAEESAQSTEEAYELYRAGVEAGERSLDDAMFEQFSGHFWDVIATRPYLRALHGQAVCALALDNSDEAITIYRRILDLNENDNQGARYLLLSCLLETGDTAGVHILLRRYENEFSAAWTYGRALVTFLERGNTRHARANLQDAIRHNPYFPLYMLGALELPEQPPEYMEIGTESEALQLMLEQGRAWFAHEKSLDWMVEVMERTPPPDGFRRV